MPRLSPPLIGVLVPIMLIASLYAVVWHPAIPPVTPAAKTAFPTEQIERGAVLAAVGDCAVCHTASGGRAYAGGRGVPTPFGTIYATNITPDPETGIGRWSEVAFQRAMRDGVDRSGGHLYPVLPYPHFTRANDQDIAAIYGFLMTRTPVSQTTPPNDLPFPLDKRFLLAGWNLLYLKPGPWQPDPAHDATWNRGAYLIEAIGHCGACHTPRNVLGAERGSAKLAGGEAENWYAPALQNASPAARPWTEDSLTAYLRTGFDACHGAAAGPMTAVTEELASVPEPDIRAMAAYVTSLMPKSVPEQKAARGGGREPEAARGDGGAREQAMFTGACGGCHAADAPMTHDGAPSLSLSTAVNAPTPRGVIQVILRGIPWREGKPTPYMPSFASALTDGQVAELAGYLRATYSDKPAWSDLPAEVAKARGAS
jgi:mono/diheme cytochrome c family protein